MKLILIDIYLICIFHNLYGKAIPVITFPCSWKLFSDSKIHSYSLNILSYTSCAKRITFIFSATLAQLKTSTSSCLRLLYIRINFLHPFFISHIFYTFDNSFYCLIDFLLPELWCQKLDMVLPAFFVTSRINISHILQLKYSFTCPSMMSACFYNMTLSHTMILYNHRFFCIARHPLYVCFWFFLNVGNNSPNFWRSVWTLLT